MSPYFLEIDVSCLINVFLASLILTMMHLCFNALHVLDAHVPPHNPLCLDVVQIQWRSSKRKWNNTTIMSTIINNIFIVTMRLIKCYMYIIKWVVKTRLKCRRNSDEITYWLEREKKHVAYFLFWTITSCRSQFVKLVFRGLWCVYLLLLLYERDDIWQKEVAERNTDRQRDRDRERYTTKQRVTERDTHKETERKRDRDKGRETERERYRQRQTRTQRQTEKHREGER